MAQSPAAPEDDAAHLLVIDDDERIRSLVARFLSGAGYRVTVAEDAADARRKLDSILFDLIIADVMMPGESGFDLLAAIRDRSAVPVIMLTALNEAGDRVRGLELGADDYLVKPFAFAELVARIEVLLRSRRGPGEAAESTVLTLADLEVDPARGRASRAGRRLDLSAKEFQLLSLLLNRQGEVLSRTEIAERVWDVTFDHGTNVIDVAIRRLRAKIDAPFDHPLLHTVRGMGYVLEVRDDEAPTPS